MDKFFDWLAWEWKYKELWIAVSRFNSFDVPIAKLKEAYKIAQEIENTGTLEVEIKKVVKAVKTIPTQKDIMPSDMFNAIQEYAESEKTKGRKTSVLLWGKFVELETIGLQDENLSAVYWMLKNWEVNSVVISAQVKEIKRMNSKPQLIEALRDCWLVWGEDFDMSATNVELRDKLLKIKS